MSTFLFPCCEAKDIDWLGYYVSKCYIEWLREQVAISENNTIIAIEQVNNFF